MTIRCTECGSCAEHVEVMAMMAGIDNPVCCTPLQCFTCGEIRDDISACKICGENVCTDCVEEHKWEDAGLDYRNDR